MHEQSVLVTDLMNLGASEFAIEQERRKLRILELSRFKHFRQTIWDKIRQKVDRKFTPHEHFFSHNLNVRDTNFEPSLSIGNDVGSTNDKIQNLSSKKTKMHKRQLSRTIQMSQNSNLKGYNLNLESGVQDLNLLGKFHQSSAESVDMNIDVQVTKFLLNKILNFLYDI